MASGQSDGNQKESQWIGLKRLPKNWRLAKEKVKNIVEQPIDKILLFLKSDMFDPHEGAN